MKLRFKIPMVGSVLLFAAFGLFSSGCGVKSSEKGKIEAFAETPGPVGNIAFDNESNLVYSLHPFFAPKVRVMKYDKVTKKNTPFPNEAWQNRSNDSDHYLDDVLGIRNDPEGNIWMLDMGLKSGITPKLVIWDSKNDRLKKIYKIPAPASIKDSQLNDFVIDSARQVVVIADEGIGNGGDGSKAALVILDLKTGASRRVLHGTRSTRATEIPITIDGQTLNIPNTTKPILVGADGIALDAKGEWLYYCPLNATKVYRIKMDDLLKPGMSDEQLESRVEEYASKDTNGGLSIDKAGNLYLTYVEKNAVGVIPAKGRKSMDYVTHPDLFWPDGVSYNKDGYMYVSAAQLQYGAVFNGGKDKTTKPYRIFRFKPMAEGLWGK